MTIGGGTPLGRVVIWVKQEDVVEIVEDEAEVEAVEEGESDEPSN